jgi:hypothetical protein
VPRTISDAHVEEVVVRTLEEVPEGATYWSKRELARRVGISPTSVHRIWRAFGLQPWRTEDFKISPDPLLIDKIRDVIGLYLAPPTNAAVFAVDEKPPGSRSPPCAHHDPLCAMQTREWTSTRTIQAALCAGERRLRSLSVTGFPSASVPGWHSSRLPTDYVGMADVSRRARGARPCPRQNRTLANTTRHGPEKGACRCFGTRRCALRRL